MSKLINIVLLLKLSNTIIKYNNTFNLYVRDGLF